MHFDAYRTLSFSRRGRVIEITLNRPESLNAVDGTMHGELARVFCDVAVDEESDVVVLTGAGRAFSAGGDLSWLQGLCGDRAAWERVRVEAKRIVFGLLDCEKPLIAKVNGHAMGLGATLALFCDVIFAAEPARIADPHVRVGLAAGDGGALIWPQLIGYARAKEYLMTGDPLSAAKAAEIGLVNHCVPADALDERVDAFAERLCGGAVAAVRYTKIAVNIGLRQIAHALMDASIAYESVTSDSDDHREALRAFLEKRAPRFRGARVRRGEGERGRDAGSGPLTPAGAPGRGD